MGGAREGKLTKNNANDANKIAANRNQRNWWRGQKKNIFDIKAWGWGGWGVIFCFVFGNHFLMNRILLKAY